MSLAATSYVLHRTFGNHIRKLLMIAIADFANDAGEAFPSIDTLAARAECSRRSVQEHLTILEKTGELAIHPNAGIRGTNLYRILFRKNPAAEPAPQGVQELHGGVQTGVAQTARGGANERRPSAPEPSGTVREPSGKEGERASAPEPSPSPDPVALPPETPAERGVLYPLDHIKAQLATVWPEAPRHMTGAEQHNLHDALRVLDELSDEDWLASQAWVQAPQRIRGGKLWPRSRAEFVANAGEAIEKIRQWWHRGGGRQWWAARHRTTGTVQQREPDVIGIDPAEPGGDFDTKADAAKFFRSIKDQKHPATV